MLKINTLQVDLFQDDSLSPTNQLKTHKDFADCKYDFSLNGSKLFLGLISLIDHDQKDLLFKTYRFTIPAIADFLNLTYNKRCREVRKVITEFEDKKILLPYYDENGQSLPIKERPSIPILSRCQISESKDFVEMKLNSELAEVLLNPEIDTMPLIVKHMSIIINLRTPRAISFYLHIKKRILGKTGKVIANTFSESLNNLKHIILMPDEIDLYPKPGNFKAKVLDKIQIDLSKHSDLCFTFTPIKANTNGHPIIGYNFVIEENLNYNSGEEIKLNPVSSRLTGVEKIKASKKSYTEAIEKGFGDIINTLTTIGLTQDGILEIIESNLKPKDVQNVIDACNSSVNNKAGFIRTKCRELLTFSAIQQEVESKQEIELVTKETSAQIEHEKNMERDNKLSHYILSLNYQQLETLVDNFKNEMPEIFSKGFEIKHCNDPDSRSFQKLKIYLSNKF